MRKHIPGNVFFGWAGGGGWAEVGRVVGVGILRRGQSGKAGNFLCGKFLIDGNLSFLKFLFVVGVVGFCGNFDVGFVRG